MIDINNFISTHITHRPHSMFLPDLESHHFNLYQQIRGKSVLVIGGAGTIGSSFIQALLPFRPGSLTVVDYSENGLTELSRDLRSSYQEVMPDTYVTYPIDFGSSVFAKVIESQPFDIVACFAAHKHVRSEKDHLAIEAMIRNNVFNTKRLLDLLTARPPQHFFAVSTDKAANPVNVMGASKKLMERVMMSYTEDFKISTARFANVAFSNGSLLFGFEERIRKGQPISAPSDVKRYFVSPEESGQLCLLACMLGETGNVFFPKLREDQMLTFSSIAKNYLQEMKLQPMECESEHAARKAAKSRKAEDVDYPVYFFKTSTSGEKMFEEFYTESDRPCMDRFDSLGVLEGELQSKGEIQDVLNDLEALFDQTDVDKSLIIEKLQAVLPDFEHVETGKSLDDGM